MDVATHRGNWEKTRHETLFAQWPVGLKNLYLIVGGPGSRGSYPVFWEKDSPVQEVEFESRAELICLQVAKELWYCFFITRSGNTTRWLNFLCQLSTIMGWILGLGLT